MLERIIAHQSTWKQKQNNQPKNFINTVLDHCPGFSSSQIDVTKKVIKMDLQECVSFYTKFNTGIGPALYQHFSSIMCCSVWLHD